jgi:hypothetical protein
MCLPDTVDPRGPKGKMGDGLNLDPWWDEPAYKAAQVSFSAKGAFILAKLQAHDAAKLKDVLADVYRDAVPDPMDVSKFERQVILEYMGASPDEIADVQARMGAGLAIAGRP